MGNVIWLFIEYHKDGLVIFVYDTIDSLIDSPIDKRVLYNAKGAPQLHYRLRKPRK